MKTEQTETCSGCQAVDELHEMTKCSKCGGWICPRCLYLPSLDAPCHCAACRSAHKAGGSVAAPLWVDRILLVPKGSGDYLERFAAAYPNPGRWANAVTREAGTQDAHVSVVVAAAKMLADFHEWAGRAASAMRHRDAKKFDRLAADYDQLCRVTICPESAENQDAREGT